MTRKKNSESTAIIVGTFIIIAVLAIIFTRTSIEKNANKESVATTVSTADPKNTLPRITISELKQLLQEKRTAIAMIDFRPPIDFAEAHIPQSQNIALEQLNHRQNLEFTEKEIIVLIGYDSGGNDDSDESISKKHIRGLSDANSSKRIVLLDGGFAQWQKQTAIVVSRGNPESIEDHMKMIPITIDQLKEIIAKKSTTYAIIDIRNNQEFTKAAIPGAINIPLSEIEFRSKEIPIGTIAIVYGADDLSGFQGAVRLYDLGFFGVNLLSGGFAKWQEN